MATKIAVSDIRPVEPEAHTGHFQVRGIPQATDYQHLKEQKQKEDMQKLEMIFTFLCFQM